MAPPPQSSSEVKAPNEPASRDTLLARGAQIPVAIALKVPTLACTHETIPV